MMEKTHEENRCANCTKRDGAEINVLTGYPVCLCDTVRDGDIVCTNFVEKGGV